MTTYKIESGDLKVKITTPFKAEAWALCIMALERRPKKVKGLGLLIQVVGGQYRGSNEIFLSTESILQDMGGMK